MILNFFGQVEFGHFFFESGSGRGVDERGREYGDCGREGGGTD